MLETPPEVSQIEGPVRDGTEPLREPLSNLAVELTRVSAELQSINAGFQAQLQQALGEMQRAMEMEFQARLDREIQATRAELIARLTETEREIERVSSLLEAVSTEITKMIDDPNAELSKVMRKKSEESLLRSYLDGLKFSAGLPR
jgi:hypothetical protein